jgi:hypothetical protein
MIAKVVYATLSTSLDTLAAATQEDDFYSVSCADRTKAYQVALAAWALANTRLAIVQSEDVDILAATADSTFDTIRDLANGRAAMLWHDKDEWADLAWVAKSLSADPDQTASVWYDKTLTGITKTSITAAQKANVIGEKGNLFLPLLGVGCVNPGVLATGAFVDELISKDWLKARITEKIAQTKLDLSNRHTKIPYTQVGIDYLASIIRGVAERGEAIGHFAPGSTVMSIPDIADVDPADITARKCTIGLTVTLAGGIREITVNVGVLNA